MRVVQPAGTRGSLKWIQLLIDRNPTLLDDEIRLTGVLQPGEQIYWASPRAADAWAEYRDGDFLDHVGRSDLRQALSEFWPNRGPQWDALGKGTAGTVVLVEAKAHLSELASTCQASPQPRLLIERSLASAKAAVGAQSGGDWSKGYYQYANRIAHLHFLQRHDVPAVLVFLYFTNDTNMNGPTSRKQWEHGLCVVYDHLGIDTKTGVRGVVNVFIDTRKV